MSNALLLALADASKEIEKEGGILNVALIVAVIAVLAALAIYFYSRRNRSNL